MTKIRAPMAATVVLAGLANLSTSAEEVYYPADQYGLVELTLPQSSGFQLESVLSNNPNFEPLQDYSPNDPLRALSRSIGRLDILYASAGILDHCTASLISAEYILTNAHCVPGQTRLGPIKRASIVMGYYAGEEGTQRYEVDIDPVETDTSLDYSILRVFGRPDRRWGTLPLMASDPEDLSSLLLIHHPGGGPKHVTRGGCRSGDPAIEQTMLLHSCDTISGSSGAPIVADGAMMGLHFGGSGFGRPYNHGTRVVSLADQSAIIRRLARRPEPTEPAPGAVEKPDPIRPSRLEIVFWESIRDSTDVRVFRAYLDRYPNGEFAVLAELKIAELTGSSGAKPPTAAAAGTANPEAPNGQPPVGGDATALFRPDFSAGNAAYDAADYATAVKHFMPLAEEGSAAAQNALGIMYRRGLGVAEDLAQAFAWFQRSAQQGHAAGQNNLGAMYARGDHVPRNHILAVLWYQRAVDQGDALAQVNLGLKYENGEGVAQDFQKAIELYRSAAQQQQVYGEYHLGLMYDRGRGVPEDDAVAAGWYARAAKQGSKEAEEALDRLKPANLDTKAAAGHQVNAVPVDTIPMEMDMVATANANVRVRPSIDATRVGSIPKRRTVKVTGKVRDANWYRIRYDGKDAFVFAPLLRNDLVSVSKTLYAANRVTVRLHAEPSTLSDPIATIPPDGAVVVSGETPDGRWYFSNYQGKQGFVRRLHLGTKPQRQSISEAQEVAVDPLSQQMVAVSHLSARAEPKAGARSLGPIAKRGTVQVTGKVRDQNWYRIRYGGRDAFVQSSLLKPVAVALSVPKSEPADRNDQAKQAPDLARATAALRAGDGLVALRIVNPLADDGDADAQVLLGTMYKNGQGVRANDKLAAAWFRRAADQGHAEAQSHLGVMHQTGRGVPEDLNKAAELYRLGAGQGSAFGQVLLGIMYKYGQGVGQSDKQAVKWFREAAAQNNALAQRYLGNAYQKGLGVAPNPATAVKWYRLAVAQGDKGASEALQGLCSGSRISGCP